MRDKNGFSLVEVMIALLVTLVIFLALMQTVLLGIDANMRNLLRDEAVRIAESRMSEAKNTPFGDPASASDSNPIGDCPFATGIRYTPGGTDPDRPVTIRNLPNTFAFCTNVTVSTTSASPATERIDVAATWTWRGELSRVDIMSLRRQ